MSSTPEYSRDIEPMIGGFEDNFYMQTIQNIRKFKGNSGGGSGTKKTINIRANANQWKDVATIYRSIGTTGLARDSYGASDVITYKQAAPRNNLQEVKMANDGENVYLYIRSEKAITAYDGKSSNWMNILIGTGSVGSKGWEGYEYVVNRSPKNTGKTSVEKLDASGKASSAGTAEYTVDGNVMAGENSPERAGRKRQKGPVYQGGRQRGKAHRYDELLQQRQISAPGPCQLSVRGEMTAPARLPAGGGPADAVEQKRNEL